MTKPLFSVPAGYAECPVPAKVSPPKGIGRPKRSQNRSTVLIKEAIMAVYRDLQEGAGGDHKHLFAWAKENPGLFYRMWMRLLPYQVDAKVNGPSIGTVMFVRPNGGE